MTTETANHLPTDIARQIITYLRDCNARPGYRLTERKLAKQFDVSRSPVRIALNMLSDKGIIESRENGGRYLAVNQDELEKHTLYSPANPVDELYEKITTDRIKNDFPETFFEADLIRRYNISRGLLVKVLNQMNAEGLVERRKGNGWRCLLIINSTDSNYYSYQFRQTLEPALLLSDRFTIDEARLERCYQQHKEMCEGGLFGMPSGEVFEVNANFHQMLADFSGNPFYQEAIRRQNQLRLSLEKRAAKHSDRMLESCHEHMEIMKAIKHGNQKTASELMSYHLTKSSRSYFGLLISE